MKRFGFWLSEWIYDSQRTELKEKKTCHREKSGQKLLYRKRKQLLNQSFSLFLYIFLVGIFGNPESTEKLYAIYADFITIHI